MPSKNVDGKRPCSLCKEVKTLDHFYFDKNRNGYGSHCKECVALKTKANWAKKKAAKPPKVPVTHKVCPLCKEDKPIDEFPWQTVGGYRQTNCRKCDYELRKDKRKADRGKSYNRRLERLNEIKTLFGCFICRKDDALLLDFHHLDSTTKDAAVAELARNNSRWEVIVQEVEKCVVLCLECHRKLHAGRFNLNKATTVVVPGEFKEL